MPKQAQLQTDFSAGELAPDLAMRRDTKQYRAGAKSLLNTRLLMGGGGARRPGSKKLFLLSADTRVEEFVVNQTTQYVLAFRAGAMNAYSRDVETGDLTAAGSVAGPWTGDIWQTMDYTTSANTIILTHPDMLCIVARTGAATWTQGAFPWYSAPSGRSHQPHTKIAAPAITLAPSGLTGNITLTTSAWWWTNSHVGSRIRYLGREIGITAVISGQVALGTVIEALPGTQTLTVTSSAGFLVDDVIEGETSTARGQVTAVPDATHLQAVIIAGYTKFEAEVINGPSATTTVSAVADAAPGAVRDWTEQLYSAQWGYPRCTEIHRARVLFAGSEALPNGVAGSSITSVFDFDVSNGSDADAFLETIGDAAAVSIIQMHSAEQLLLLTDVGPYYVPESQLSPFRPSSLAFNHFGGNWPCSNARTGDFDGGVIMVSGSLIVKLFPTGGTSKMWDARELTLLCPHLIKAPTDTAFVANFANGPERYSLFVNDDGTAAVVMLVDEQSIRNAVPWETNGTYRSFCALGGDVYAVVKRGDYFLERFDTTYRLDCSTVYATQAEVEAIGAVIGSTYNVVVVGKRYSLGLAVQDMGDIPVGPYEVGQFFERRMELLPPHIEDHNGGNMRIASAYVHVLESALFTVNGTSLQAYQVTDSLDQEPPVKQGPQRFTFLGWGLEPTLTITQPDPLDLTVLGVRTTVAY